jgi:hypothetical protein
MKKNTLQKSFLSAIPLLKPSTSDGSEFDDEDVDLLKPSTSDGSVFDDEDVDFDDDNDGRGEDSYAKTVGEEEAMENRQG